MYLALVLFIFVAIYLQLIWKSGSIYPILHLFLFTYFLQYIFSTYFVYNTYPALAKQMPIQQYEYFSYSVIALAFLFSGIFLFNKDINIENLIKKIDPELATSIGYFCLFASLFFDVASRVVPSLGSVLSLTEYLKYVASFCFLFSKSRLSILWVILIYIHLATNALQGSVFLDFMIWSTHLFFFITIKFNLSFIVRVSFIFLAAPLLILIQSVKSEYRKETWNGRREAGLDYLTELAGKQYNKSEEEGFLQSSGVAQTAGRLSLGWHLGKTLKHVPAKEPFANGSDMFGDIVGSLLPRLFFPDKKTVGSHDKFFRYTGHRLRGSTSMTIGVLGDFYINYGYWGSLIMLFIFGAFISKILYFFMAHYVIPQPIHIVWVPYMLSYLIRANNDFYMVFNSLTKGFLVFLFLSFVHKRLWPHLYRKKAL